MSQPLGEPVKRQRISEDADASIPQDDSLLSYQLTNLSARLKDMRSQISLLTSHNSQLQSKNSQITLFLSSFNASWAKVIFT